MAKAAGQKHLGIYISPKEICISQVKLGKDKPETEHLVKFPTDFPVKEGMMRPLSLNNEFFSEKAQWVAQFKQAVKKVSWDSSTAVVTLSPQFAILRYFVMPAVERRFWSKSIPLESKKYIPVSFEEVVYDFNALPADGGKKLGVLFGLTQRKSVEFITETLKGAGLTLAAVETTPISFERVFGYLDPKDHDAKGYIHFSENSTYMLFSHAGSPVLYRETETDAGGSMSERKRLDVKGGVQFVDRYVGGKEYKAIMLSGDGADGWKPVADKEAAPIQSQIWDIAKAGGLKDNDAASLLACAAALRGRTAGPALPDISGLSSAANLEKQVQSYVWNISFVLGGLILLLWLFAEARVIMLSSRISSLKAKVVNVPELEGLEADVIRTRMDNMRTNATILDGLVSEVDPLAPKLASIADRIPPDLWVADITYTNPFALSEVQSGTKELRIMGETFLRGELKGRLVEVFTKSLKTAPEFKLYGPPFGGIDSTTEEGGRSGTPGGPETQKTSGYAVVCTIKRK
ncbi:MAG TPA: hypothetical protein DEQ38_07920 [Elusimicrobia bacterium]|nr:MAG: hypothetical protein A2089_06215 [Elusimicrobia bacterium GWD2_63_28]HCC48022.1 hypothetical protein [Elusimicrobiota bacterium]